MDEMVLLSTEEVHRDAHGRLQALLCMRIITTDGRQLTALPPGSIDVSGYLPPFAAVVVDPATGSVSACTDPCGIGHLYWAEGDGWAAISTSSTVLGSMVGEGLDHEAIGTFALTGSYLGTSTPYRSVRKLAGGEHLDLCAGRVHRNTPRHARERSLYERRGQAVEAGVSAVRNAVQGCLRAAPDAGLELSGGLDSRMLLAAIDPSNRAERMALTIGAPESSEVRTARSLADKSGLRHVTVDTTGLARLDEIQVATLLENASRTRDHSGNPLALGVLDWVEQLAPQGPRLSGQNGEFARGFYYPAQLDRPGATPRLVKQLARWRILTNDHVDDWLLDPSCRDEMRAQTIAELQHWFSAAGGTWLQATDEYYLRQRMQRWVGIAYTTACTSRAVLAPFFHPEFLQWALRSRTRDKRASSLFAEVLTALDPTCAALPLSDRPAPVTLADPGPSDRARHALSIVRKAGHKVGQRISGQGRPPLGATHFARVQQRVWQSRPHLLDPLRELPFLSQEALSGVATGERSLSPNSVSFLVTLTGMLDSLEPIPSPRGAGRL